MGRVLPTWCADYGEAGFFLSRKRPPCRYAYHGLSYEGRPAYMDMAMNTIRSSFSITMGLLLCAFMAACAPVKIKTEIYAVDGSRSGGTLDVAYEPGTDGLTVTDRQQGLSLASAKCGAWGYHAADVFGGRVTLPTRIIVKYQCLGSPSDGAQVAAQIGMKGTAGALDKTDQMRALSNRDVPYEEYQRHYQAILAQ